MLTAAALSCLKAGWSYCRDYIINGRVCPYAKGKADVPLAIILNCEYDMDMWRKDVDLGKSL